MAEQIVDLSPRQPEGVPDSTSKEVQDFNDGKAPERFKGEVHQFASPENKRGSRTPEHKEDLKALQDRQSGIKSWEKFQADKAKAEERAEAHNPLEKLTPEQREQWREKGEIPKDAQPENEKPDTSEQQNDVAKQLNEAKGRYPDAEEVILPLAKTLMEDAAVPDTVRSALSASPVLADVLYVIGTDPANVKDFIETAKTDPGAAIRKAAIIERLVMEELEKASGSKTGSGERVGTQETEAQFQERTQTVRANIQKASETFEDWAEVVSGYAAASSRIPADLDAFLGRAVVDAKNPAALLRQMAKTQGLFDSLAQAWSAGNSDWVLATINNIDSNIRPRNGAPAGASGTRERTQAREGREIKAPVEVGGRGTATEDAGTAAARAGDFRSAKTAWDRQYASRRRD